MSGENIKTKNTYLLQKHFEPIALILNDKLYDELRSDGRKLFSSDPHNQAISHNTLLFYQIEPFKNGPFPVFPCSLSRDS